MTLEEIQKIEPTDLLKGIYQDFYASLSEACKIIFETIEVSIEPTSESLSMSLG
jgi:hypothetical protein